MIYVVMMMNKFVWFLTYRHTHTRVHTFAHKNNVFIFMTLTHRWSVLVFTQRQHGTWSAHHWDERNWKTNHPRKTQISKVQQLNNLSASKAALELQICLSLSVIHHFKQTTTKVKHLRNHFLKVLFVCKVFCTSEQNVLVIRSEIFWKFL